ncbi:MAG: hypothetical protein ABIP81_06235 [Terriglobales bacterium]
MARLEQYEVWASTKGQWGLVAAFLDIDVASAVFKNRTYSQRLIHAVYEDGKLVQRDILAEVGGTREEP